jgi:hypothetical protein
MVNMYIESFDLRCQARRHKASRLSGRSRHLLAVSSAPLFLFCVLKDTLSVSNQRTQGHLFLECEPSNVTHSRPSVVQHFFLFLESVSIRLDTLKAVCRATFFFSSLSVSRRLLHTQGRLFLEYVSAVKYHTQGRTKGVAVRW